MRVLKLAYLLVFGATGVSAAGSDWPQFLGPERTGVTAGEGLAKTWPKEGPPVVWRKNVGQGFAGPAVKDGKVIVFHRVDDKELVECLGASDGKPVWTYGYPTSYRDGFSSDYGPRSVPAIADGKVFTFGADGAIRCVAFASGEKVWGVEARGTFGAEKGFFGLAGSPLVDRNAVYLNIGGKNGAGVVALGADTGALLWKSTNQEADYSSPAMATLHGDRRLLVFLREGLFGLDPSNGKVRFKFRWRARMHASVNAAMPVVVGNRVFLTSSYNTGDNLLELGADDSVKSVWSGDSFSSQYATPMHKAGFLYGLAGRHDSYEGTSPRCVEIATGKVRWTIPGLKCAAMIMAGDALLTLTERGELIRIPADADKGSIAARAQILGSGVRAQPALARGKLYARDGRRLVCVDLGAK